MKLALISFCSAIAISASAQTPLREEHILALMPRPPTTPSEAMKRYGKVQGDEIGDTKTKGVLKELTTWSDELDSAAKALVNAKAKNAQESAAATNARRIYFELTEAIRSERDKYDFIQNAAFKEFKDSDHSEAAKQSCLRKLQLAYPALAKRTKEVLETARAEIERTTKAYKGNVPPIVVRQINLVEAAEISMLTKLLSTNRRAVVETGAPPATTR